MELKGKIPDKQMDELITSYTAMYGPPQLGRAELGLLDYLYSFVQHYKDITCVFCTNLQLTIFFRFNLINDDDNIDNDDDKAAFYFSIFQFYCTTVLLLLFTHVCCVSLIKLSLSLIRF